MSWTRALFYVAVAALFALAVWATTPAPPPPMPAPAAPGPEIVAVAVSAGDRRVTARRIDDRWVVAPPHGEAVTSDLVDALLAAVLNAPAEPVVGSGPSGEFGLDQPFARIELQRRDGKPVTVRLGNTSPAATGVYGQLEGNPQILLMGLNVRYYVELMIR